MKFTTNKLLFREALVNADYFTSQKLSIPKLIQCVLIKTEEDQIILHTTNLSDHFEAKLKATVSKQGEAAVEAKSLIEYLNLLEDENVEIEASDNSFSIREGKNQAEFPILDSTEYPPSPTTKIKPETYDKTLFEDISRVFFSASKDDARPHLTGVNISTKDKEMFFVTTDGFRLSVIRLQKTKTLPNITLSTSILDRALKLSVGQKEINASFDEEQKVAFFQINNITITTRFIEGEFPPFEKVIPAGFKTRLILPREEFLRSLKLAAVVLPSSQSVVLFDIKKDGLYITPKTTTGHKAVSFLTVEGFEGEPIKIAFNYRFIIEFLSVSKGKNIIFEATEPTAPCVFKIEGDNSFLHVIMPLRTEETS